MLKAMVFIPVYTGKKIKIQENENPSHAFPITPFHLCFFLTNIQLPSLLLCLVSLYLIKTPNKGTLCGIFFLVENIKYFNTYTGRRGESLKGIDTIWKVYCISKWNYLVYKETKKNPPSFLIFHFIFYQIRYVMCLDYYFFF